MRFAGAFCSLLSAFFEVRVLFFYMHVPPLSFPLLSPSLYSPPDALFSLSIPFFFRINIVVVFHFPLPVLSALLVVLFGH